MQTVIIRGIDFDDIMEVHDYLSEELDFPHYYGRNLSALYDCLTEISDDVRIIVDLEDMTDDEFQDQLIRMVEVMKDAAHYNNCIEVECDE